MNSESKKQVTFSAVEYKGHCNRSGEDYDNNQKNKT
jgi:hypothetical protein